MYTLCVIDMQHYFTSNFNSEKALRLKNNVIKQIKKAIKDKAHILFVEYMGLGKTLKSLTSLVEKYSNISFISKEKDNGGPDILLQYKKYSKRQIRICGINTSFCVKSTVYYLSLYSKYSSIQILKDSCACFTKTGHEKSLKQMSGFSKVEII